MVNAARKQSVTYDMKTSSIIPFTGNTSSSYQVPLVKVIVKWGT